MKDSGWNFAERRREGQAREQSRILPVQHISEMTVPSFVHLRLHSEYSVVDSTVRIDDAVAAAVRDGMPALALTDLANAFGLIKFYKAARGAGLKPIAGCDVWITHDSERDRPFRAILLAASRDGYLKLCAWLSRAYRANQHRGRAELRREWFGEGTDGLIALSGARDGDVGQRAAAGQSRRRGTRGTRMVGLVSAALLPRGATCRSCGRRCAGRSHRRARRRARLAGRGHASDAISRARATFARTRRAFASPKGPSCPTRADRDASRPSSISRRTADMVAKFADLPEALANSVAIAQRCNLTISLGQNHLPEFPTPAGVTIDEHLRDEAIAGLERRLLQLYPDAAARDAKRPEYMARLEFETKTIVQMGFAGYFLIVADFINWAKRNQVPVGPGRGSGAGSLVAYSLGVTDLDPIRYALLFERFLNPERVSMPDFDIDFCQNGRDRVIDYVKAKYGADSVSQIATFGTLAARAAVRDVGRVLDMPYLFVDGIAKLIPFAPGKQVLLKRPPARKEDRDNNAIYAREAEPQLVEREAAEEEVRQLLELAEQLEGLPRNVGMHAGGVLIAPGKLTDFCPLYVQPGADAILSQFDKDDVEAVGLVKFDFLGLTTLTILDWTLKYIRLLDPAADIALDALPLDDRAAYDIFKTGNTVAVFQFESRGMRDLLKQAPPTRFEDIIALVALYRPGPMALIPDYIARKSGRERVPMPDPRLEPILEPTYGVMVYQEQVMQIAQVIGGYSLGGADLLRRAMGKKKPEEMATHRTIFVEGAVKNKVSEGRATLLFNDMEKFAGYGFNRSHAAAYALIAYQTAWFKAHHPAAFMAANLVAGHGRHRQGAALPRRRDRARARGCCRRMSTRRTTVSNRWTQSRSATAWAASRAPAQSAIEAVDRRARRGRAVPRSLRFLPPRGQTRRQPARGGGAGARRRVRRDRTAPRGVAGVGRHGARGRRARRSQRGAGIAVRRGGGGTHDGPGCDARLVRRRTAAEREIRRRLLPVRASLQRLRRGIGARGAHRAVGLGAQERSRAGRRHRHADARAERPTREDGLRHARRWPRFDRDHGLQRDSTTACATCCATTSWLSPR